MNKRNEYFKKRYLERRQKALVFLGGKCIHCGSTENLELDHKDHKTKSFEISKLWGTSLERFWEEIKKCQLLCKACHIKKTTLERGNKVARGTHGTISAYRYCKCILCKTAMRDYKRKYRLIVQRENGVLIQP